MLADKNDVRQKEYEQKIKENPMFIKTIRNPSQELCDLAFSLDKNVFPYISNNKRMTMCEDAVAYNYQFISYVPAKCWTKKYTAIVLEHIELFDSLLTTVKTKMVSKVNEKELLYLANNCDILDFCNIKQLFILITNLLIIPLLVCDRRGIVLIMQMRNCRRVLNFDSIPKAVKKIGNIAKYIRFQDSIIPLLLPEEKQLLGINESNNAWTKITNSVLSNTQESTNELMTIDTANQSLLSNESSPILASGSGDEIFHYISDIHLIHQIQARGLTTPQEIRDFLWETVNSFPRNIRYSIFAGDISSNFELYKIFFNMYLKITHSHVIVILGNHELFEGPSYVESIRKYKQYFAQFENVTFLHNQYMVLNKNKYLIFDSLEKIKAHHIVPEMIILGGIGFAKLGKYSSTHINYGPSFNKPAKIDKESNTFEKLYQQLVNSPFGCKKIIISHTAPEEWTTADLDSQIIYVHGHTHRNQSYKTQDGAQICASGQIGYQKREIKFACFVTDISFDTFELFEDGIHNITLEEYQLFLQHKNILATIFRDDLQIFMLKRDGYYMFFAFKRTKKGDRWYILHGGRIIKTDISCINDIKYFYNLIPQYVNNLSLFISQYRKTQEVLAQAIINIGGIGKIHGCIIDIEKPAFNLWSTCHIYLNPLDGRVTFYYAKDISSRIVYPTFMSMLKEPSLKGLLAPIIDATKESKNNQALALLNKVDAGVDVYEEQDVEPIIDYGTEMYKLSRLIYKIQRIYDKHVISIWSEVLAKGKQDAKANERITALPASNPFIAKYENVNKMTVPENWERSSDVISNDEKKKISNTRWN